LPNPIKYNISTESNALNVGSFWIGTGDVSKGPTNSTGFWNGIDPPSGGYAVYVNKASGGPSIAIANNDSELIAITNNLAGTSYTTVDQCFTYFDGQTDKMVISSEFNPCVTQGLLKFFDATSLPSYPRSGSAWKNLATDGSDGSIINGLTFGSDGRFTGYLNFDGADDYISVSSTPGRSSTVNTVEMWARWRSGNSDMFVGWTTYDIWTSGSNLGFNTGQSDVYGISSTDVSNLGLVGTGEDNWHHYIFEFTDQVQDNKIYIDTIEQTLSQQSSSTNLTATRSFSTNFKIGGWNNSTGYGFTGDVAIFRLYNKSLTQDEIHFNYFGSNVEVDGDYVKIFRQYSGGGDFFSSANDWEEAKNTNEGKPDSNKYSILNTLEKYKRDGKFTLKIDYPSLGTTNIWSQTNNPVTDSGSGGVTGYTAISIDTTANGWGGLERYDAQTSTFLDGTLTPQSNWYYAIGSKSWSSSTTFPGPSSPVSEVELWVKYR